MGPRTWQGETEELCKWTVDLSVLPSFQRAADTPSHNGFYTGTPVAASRARVLMLLAQSLSWGWSWTVPRCAGC